jgi:nicotinamide phosphoribosyltransferase
VVLGAAWSAGYHHDGGLLQKLNRDTQRCAIKACAQMRGGKWYDCFKEPLDKTKTSMHGLLVTTRDHEGHLFTTHKLPAVKDAMETVFENGTVMGSDRNTFAQIRERAALK